jgi:hypothetical protein
MGSQRPGIAFGAEEAPVAGAAGVTARAPEPEPTIWLRSPRI